MACDTVKSQSVTHHRIHSLRRLVEGKALPHAEDYTCSDSDLIRPDEVVGPDLGHESLHWLDVPVALCDMACLLRLFGKATEGHCCIV